jgi:3-mercaptopyruvate sulfurtransferase SseA
VPQQHGGRHPFADVTTVSNKLGSIGIDQDTTVIVYDEEGMFAARFWYQLHYLGHSQVYILDGGIKNWIAHGYPVTDEKPVAKARTFIPQIKEHILTMEEGTWKNKQALAQHFSPLSKDKEIVVYIYKHCEQVHAMLVA